MNPIVARISRVLKEDTVLRRVLRNTSYLFSSQSATTVFSFVQSIFAARLLGVELLGLLGIITTFVTNVNQLFSFRMGEFIVRFMGKELNDRNIDRAGAVVKAAALTEGITSILAYVALYLLAPLGVSLFAGAYAGDPMVIGLVRLFGLSILAQLTSETANGILQITNHFRTQAAINLIQGGVTAALILVAFLIKADFLFVLWAYLIGKLITGIAPILMAVLYLNRHLKAGWWHAPLSQLPSFKDMAKFAVSTNLNGTVKMLATGSEALWVGLFLDTSAVGLYKVALGIVSPFMLPVSAFLATTFPEVTRSVVAKKWSELKQLLKRVSLISLVWSAVGLIGTLLLGRWALSTFYGADFVGGYSALVILILGFGVSNIAFWNRSLLLAFTRPNTPLLIMAGSMVVKILLSFVVIPAFGINGAAALLAGNLFLSVGAIAAIGLLLVRKSEKLEPEVVQS